MAAKIHCQSGIASSSAGFYPTPAETSSSRQPPEVTERERRLLRKNREETLKETGARRQGMNNRNRRQGAEARSAAAGRRTDEDGRTRFTLVRSGQIKKKKASDQRLTRQSDGIKAAAA